MVGSLAHLQIPDTTNVVFRFFAPAQNDKGK
jgi:hypothetical protein